MNEAALEELEALEAIYGEEAITERRKDYYEIQLECGDSRVRLQVSLPEEYPTDALPILGVSTVHGLSEHKRVKVLEVATEAARRTQGEVCIFEVVTSAQECLEELREIQCDKMDKKNESWTFCPAHPEYGQRSRRFDSASVDPLHAVEIFSSEAIVERKSTFQAFLAKDLTSVSQVNWALRELLSRPKLAKATHNIWAYRLVDSEHIVRADCDDDGEDGASIKMAHILDLFSPDDSGCLVMVSRWFGGVKLGPDRFKIIAKMTQSILQANGIQRRASSTKANISKASIKQKPPSTSAMHKAHNSALSSQSNYSHRKNYSRPNDSSSSSSNLKGAQSADR